MILFSKRFLFFLLTIFSCIPSQCFAVEQPKLLDAVDFNQDIRPILSNHCFACHGPDENHREADMRLDVPDEVDPDSIAERIASDDPEMMMPPPKLNKPLTAEQIETLKRWISEGADYQQHWAFAPVKKPTTPTLADKHWSEQPIDQFVLARLEKKGLRPSPPADKRTLIRRVTFDLTGLPPTIEEIENFLADDSPDAYANWVDELLSRPQYGEHLARYWLDLVRFADTNGLHHDHYRDMTPYRDWVIRSFNDNLPYDQFVTAQLAGDLFPTPTTDQLIASGFNRLHLIIDVGTALPEESFHRNVVDRVSAFGAVFVGLTTQCAVCHDHKYDPLTQRDFYQLYAFFNNIDAEPETGGRGTSDFKRGLQAPFMNLPSPDQADRLAEIDSTLNEYRLEKTTVQAKLDETSETEKEKIQQEIDAITKRIESVQAQRDTLEATVPAALVMKERTEVRPTTIMIRGNYDSPGQPVERNTPAFLPPMKDTGVVKTRMDLAEWVTDPTNPLTARVAVNRFWQQFFGVGLVKTSEDFGAQGQPPSHPELLDHLTVQFVDSGWNIKSLMREIVLSKTYQQTSTAPRESFVSDPENRLLARGSRYRLDAEMIRDQILAVSGLLNKTMYGKSVKPPQPAGLWETVTMPSSFPRSYEADQGTNAVRRSVYTFWKRAIAPPQLSIFDAPTREACIARRERTNTPLQALVLMNEEDYFAAAIHLAKSLLDHTDWSNEERIARAYELITAQQPNAAIKEELGAAYIQFENLYQNNPSAAAEMLTNGTDPAIRGLTDSTKQIQLAALSMIVHSLLNMDFTKTRN